MITCARPARINASITAILTNICNHNNFFFRLLFLLRGCLSSFCSFSVCCLSLSLSISRTFLLRPIFTIFYIGGTILRVMTSLPLDSTLMSYNPPLRATAPIRNLMPFSSHMYSSTYRRKAHLRLSAICSRSYVPVAHWWF